MQLELPVSYDNYPDFRHERNKALELNMRVIDIVQGTMISGYRNWNAIRHSCLGFVRFPDFWLMKEVLQLQWFDLSQH